MADCMVQARTEQRQGSLQGVRFTKCQMLILQHRNGDRISPLHIMRHYRGFLEKGKDRIQEKDKLGQGDQVLLSLKMATY